MVSLLKETAIHFLLTMLKEDSFLINNYHSLFADGLMAKWLKSFSKYL